MSRTGQPSIEPTLGITAGGTIVLYPAITEEALAMAVSTDGGASWETRAPSLQGEPTRATTLDPYLFLDPATGRIFIDDLTTGTCSLLSWTDDAGTTWEHSAAGCMETDHQTLFAGPPTVTATVGFPNVLYRCAINGGLAADASLAATCQRSIDGGRAWLAPGEPAFPPDPEGEGHNHLPGYCDGGTGHVFVDQQGTLYLPKGWCGQPWLAISKDEGTTWTRVQVADNGMPRDDFGRVAHEASVAVDTAGTVYYAWAAEDRLPYMATSRDGGTTWSRPVMIGPPGLTQAAIPQLIAGGERRFAVAYMGSTNAPVGPHPDEHCLEDPPHGCPQIDTRDDAPDLSGVTWNGYLTLGLEGLQGNATLLTAPVNPPEDPLIVGRCGAINCQELADFMDVRIGPDGTAYASFVDGCSARFTTCEPEDGDRGEGVVGWISGVPTLWGPEDSNGPYP